MTRNGKMNFCTETIYIAPETSVTKGILQKYTCEKNGYRIMACRHYRPLTGSDGLVCHGECKWFENGCTCKAARAAAHRRTERILKKLMR